MVLGHSTFCRSLLGGYLYYLGALRWRRFDRMRYSTQWWPYEWNISTSPLNTYQHGSNISTLFIHTSLIIIQTPKIHHSKCCYERHHKKRSLIPPSLSSCTAWDCLRNELSTTAGNFSFHKYDMINYAVWYQQKIQPLTVYCYLTYSLIRYLFQVTH